MKKRTFYLIFSSLIIFMVLISTLNLNYSNNQYNTSKKEEDPISSSLEGAENVLITELRRNGTLSGYGMVHLVDKITILNQNDNPINSFYFGVPLKHSEDLIFYKATGKSGESLFIDRSGLVMNDFEMLIIHFDTPLLPNQDTSIFVYESFKNLFIYNIFYDPDLQVHHNFTFNPWPIVPYRAEGEIYAAFQAPSTITELYWERIGSTGNIDDTKKFTWDLSRSLKYDHLDPFLENLEDALDSRNGKQYITILFQDTVLKLAELHVEEINREIHISPWGLIKVVEEVEIQNHGYFDQRTVFINVPASAKNINLYDDLGSLSGTLSDIIDDNRRNVEVNLVENRALLTPSSKIRLTIEYNLQFEDYFSINWFQQSMKLDILTSHFEYLGKKQSIDIIIEGCGNIDFISTPPDAIKQIGGTKVISYYSDYVSSEEDLVILLTYSINLFDLLLRPILIMLALVIILSAFVLITKTKKADEEESVFKKEFLPTNEIREFCSLYEEMNALVLEIRKAEEETKRKKIAKKTYKNILTKNTTKIDQIKDEIAPFKKILIESSETFENIVKKLEILDAERISVNDSLTLLETRYKRGRLPSKQAYEKLSNDFLNRRKKIDRTIDRLIQQLRSYLL